MNNKSNFLEIEWLLSLSKEWNIKASVTILITTRNLGNFSIKDSSFLFLAESGRVFRTLPNIKKILFFRCFTGFWIRLWKVHLILSVIRQKGEFQNGCFKKTKHAKFSKNEHFLSPDTQIEIALVNDSLRASKLSWKFRIWAVLLYFTHKICYFLLFSVFKQSFTAQ